MARKLIVEIIGDASSLEKSYRQAGKATGKFGDQVERAGRGAAVATVGFKGLGRSVAFASGAFLGGAGLTKAVSSSISAASDLNEQINKTNVVFGQSAAEIKDWSESSASAMGLARDQALAVASSFGALFAPLGLVGRQAAAQSEKLTQLGADLASFYNTDVQDALDAIRSGLVGESEPLRRYGVLLSETRVQAEALAETHKTSAKTLTDLEKVTARVNLIFKDSKKAQGDFKNTSDGLANQTRILKANIRDLGATIGQYLLPPLNRSIRAINEIAKGPPVEDVLTPDPLRAALVPKLARDFERLKTEGKSTAEAMKILRDRLGDSQKGAELLAEAIRYTFSEKTRRDIAKIRQEVRGFTTDAEAAAKAASGIGLAAAARAAAAPRGTAALPQGQRLEIALSRARLTKTPADELKVLVQQRELYAKQLTSLQNRLARATGKKARDLADQLQEVLSLDAAAYSDITSIEQDAANRAAEAARKAAEAARKTAEAEKRHREALRKIAAANVRTAAERVKAINEAAVAQVKAIRAFSDRVKAQQVAREQAKVFGLLGLGPTGEELAPTRGNLQAALKKAQAAIAGTPVDTKAMESRLSRLRDVINTEFNKLNRDTRIKVKEFLDALSGKDSDHPLTRGGAVGGRNLALMLSSGLHLSGAQLNRFESNLNAQKLTAFTIDNRIHVDGREMGRVATKAQQRDQYRTARQTSGFRG